MGRATQRPRSAGAQSIARVPDWLAVVVLIVVGGGVPIAVAWHFDALGIPRNDDWAYLLSAFWFARDHGFNFYQWPGMTLVGQVLAAAPTALAFERRITPLQLEVVASGVIGLVAVYDLGRRLLSSRAALFVALTVAVGPLWIALAPTFMTDIPSLALAMVSLAVGARALTGNRLRPWVFALSLVVGLVGVSVRDHTVIAPVAVGLTAVWVSWGSGRRARTAAILGLVATIVAAVLVRKWALGLEGHQVTEYSLTGRNVRRAFTTVVESVPAIGILVGPAVLLAGPRALTRASFGAARRVSVLAAIVMALVAVRIVVDGTLSPGNYLSAEGTLETAVMRGVRPPLLGDPLRSLIGFLGVAAFAVLVFAAIPPLRALGHRLRARDLHPTGSPTDTILVLAAVGYAVTIIGPAALGNTLIDRYLLPLVPLLAILVVRTGHSQAGLQDTSRRWIAVAGLVGLAALGLVYGANSASFDGARWKAAQAATRVVGDPNLVDGGFEWDNFHYEYPVYVRPDDPAWDGICVASRVRADRPDADDPTVLAVEPVWGIGGPQAWIVTRRVADCP